MPGKVTKMFRHANTGRLWRVGDEFDGTEAQAAELAAKGYVDYAREPGAGAADYDGMTAKQLVALCVERKVDTPAKPKKADLVAALKAAD